MSIGRHTLIFVALFSLGTAVGMWTFVSPWIVGFPMAGDGSWTNSVRATLWAGGIVIACSAVGLLALPAIELRYLARQAREK